MAWVRRLAAALVVWLAMQPTSALAAPDSQCPQVAYWAQQAWLAGDAEVALGLVARWSAICDQTPPDAALPTLPDAAPSYASALPALGLLGLLTVACHSPRRTQRQG